MKINYDKLRVGDLIFTRSYSPLGVIIRAVTKGPASHVGIYIGWGKIAEMGWDLKFGDNDLHINKVSRYTQWWTPWNRIYAIKRSPVYDNKIKQVALLERIKNFIAEYDVPELFSHVFKTEDKKKRKYVCSGAAYELEKKDGVPFKEYTRGYFPSPNELMRDSALFDVLGWKG